MDAVPFIFLYPANCLTARQQQVVTHHLIQLITMLLVDHSYVTEATVVGADVPSAFSQKIGEIWEKYFLIFTIDLEFLYKTFRKSAE